MKKSRSTAAMPTSIALLVTSILVVTNWAAAEETRATKLPQYSDRTWVTIKGTVVDQKADSFILDYGQDTIVVEMDDWDKNHEGELVFLGDEVTVNGRVDNDFYHKKTIEAESLYVDDLNLSIQDASATDEEGILYSSYLTSPSAFGIEVRGKVTAVEGREFTLDTDERELRVDTNEMNYNPMDDKGYQRIKPGDLISVGGNLENSLFDERELMAHHIVSIQ